MTDMLRHPGAKPSLLLVPWTFSPAAKGNALGQVEALEGPPGAGPASKQPGSEEG